MQFNIKKSIALLVLLFIGVIFMYRSTQLEKIKHALFEHTLVVAEPMWNFDNDGLDQYLRAVAERNNYQSLKITTLTGSLFYELTADEPGKLNRTLSSLGLIPQRNFSRKISYQSKPLGSLEVVWRDTSIYFYSYACLVFLLLVVIVNLVASVLRSKKSLEEQFLVVQEAMNELRQQKDYIEDIFNLTPEGLITVDKDKIFIENNKSFDSIIHSWADTLDKDPSIIRSQFLEELRQQLHKHDGGQYTMLIDEQNVDIEYSSSAVPSFHDIDRVVSLRDITKLTQMEKKLAQSQKLEAVGRLASGIAHEINTPTQYVLSNMDFLIEAYQDIEEIMAKVDLLIGTVEETQQKGVITEISTLFEDADWKYLEEEIPKALDQSKEGLRRISHIVSAMKHFSHPSGNSADPSDINLAIKTTVAVASNEWKYAANIDLQLDTSLPLIPCNLDEINQVFLSMIVNSAHAIEDKNGKDTDVKGTITIKTTAENGQAVITISDDGIGIPEAIREKVFDPFFTTKELNKGTGQGLAIAHDVIVNRHDGAISVDSEQNSGTTFTISLPINQEA